MEKRVFGLFFLPSERRPHIVLGGNKRLLTRRHLFLRSVKYLMTFALSWDKNPASFLSTGIWNQMLISR